ncbi:MAG: TonB-dependent receptor [Candidatus Pseudobacter hemicellulosilyticus]|uniref:TonB-dependent receptor n=1 Tax=Candidatus Pseudobacter hemicellulosilyticus TaxID=3121375 RepID=A0AAJ5WQQ0_9BACT|nr:MAG: TonB-dependent receptor [Pseudobacter sp.]
MRLLAVQITMSLCLGFSLYAKDLNGQDILDRKISLSVEKESLLKVIVSIQKQIDSKFIFSANAIQANREISCFAVKKPLSVLLKELLEPLHIGFRVVDEQVVLYPETVASIPDNPRTGIFKLTTDRIVTGMVRDNEGNPLPGATVSEKGAVNATATDGEGRFRISFSGTKTVLVFTAVGYETQEIAVSESTTVVNVSLKAAVKSLDDVVVIAYGTTKKKDLLSAVSSIKGRDIEQLPVATPQSLIQGRASGVQVVQNSGAPGGGVTVRIRGTTSINAGNDPLYIVDGVPVESGTLSSINLSGSQTSALSAINPDDIESMEVLKDAGALAIYGSRAANGVVLITTKRGKRGATSYSLNYYTGWQQDNPSTRLKLMNSQQAMELVQEGRANALNYGVPSVYGWLLPDSNGKLYNTDWQDAILQTAPISNYEFAIRGGEKKLRFALSAGYFDQAGIIIRSGYKRGSMRLNLDYDASDKLKFGTNISVSRYLNKRVSTEDGATSVIQVALKKSPSMPIYNNDGTFYNGDVSGFMNPVAFANKLKYENQVTSVLGNVYAEYTIIPRLIFRSTIGINYASVLDTYFQPSDAVRNGEASGSAFSSNVTGWVNENTLSYSKIIGRHSLSALAGYSLQERSAFAISAAGRQYATNNIYTLNAASMPTDASSSRSANGLSSVFGRVGYAFGDKYLLEATARRDGSSRFGANQRYAIFPALSAAWRISNEVFWKSDLINDLKLRASAGRTGNQTIGDYVAQGQFTTGANYAGQSGIGMSVIPNPDLTWETTDQYNAGLDISLFKSRVILNIDAYVKKTSNLLLNVPLPNTSGFSSVLQNIGATENKGLEFNLNTVNISKEDFTWNSNFNISFNNNKIVQLYSGESRIIVSAGQGLSGSLVSYSILEVGRPIGSFYGWHHNGVYQNSTDNKDKITNTSTGTNGYLFRGGDLIFDDINSNKTIDNDDRMVIGEAQPKFTGGFTNSFTYKSFDLNILTTFCYGNDVVNGTRYAAESITGFNGTLDLLRRWRNEGDVTDIPKLTWNDPSGSRRFSNRWIEDGSYLRIKNITVGYTLPAAFLKKTGLRTCRVYATGQNVVTFTKYKGYDPEASAFSGNVAYMGIDQATYPQYRALTLGISVGF